MKLEQKQTPPLKAENNKPENKQKIENVRASVFSNEIVSLRELISEEDLMNISAKCKEIENYVNSLEDFIKTNFSKDLLENSNFIEELREKMYKKSKDILNFVHNRIDNNSFDVNQILKELENIQTEKELLFSSIKLAKNLGEDISLEDIKSLDLSKISPSLVYWAEIWLKEIRDSLPEEQIKEYETIGDEVRQMKEIYKNNYSNNPEMQEYLVNDFDKFVNFRAENPSSGSNLFDSEMYILKYKDKVISFDRFDPEPNHIDFHFKSFNVEKDFRGSGVGSIMIKATLDKKSEKSAIFAECISSKPISSFYIENGFIAKKISNFKGEKIFDIVRKDKFIPIEFKTKQMIKEDILSENNLPPGTVVKKVLNQKDCDFSYIIPENYITDPWLKKLSEINKYYNLPEKYVLTRYFFDEKSQNWVTVFEEVNKDLSLYL